MFLKKLKQIFWKDNGSYVKNCHLFKKIFSFCVKNQQIIRTSNTSDIRLEVISLLSAKKRLFYLIAFVEKGKHN